MYIVLIQRFVRISEKESIGCGGRTIYFSCLSLLSTFSQKYLKPEVSPSSCIIICSRLLGNFSILWKIRVIKVRQEFRLGLSKRSEREVSKESVKHRYKKPVRPVFTVDKDVASGMGCLFVCTNFLDLFSRNLISFHQFALDRVDKWEHNKTWTFSLPDLRLSLVTLYCYYSNKIETSFSYLVKIFDIKVSCSINVEKDAEGDIFGLTQNFRFWGLAYQNMMCWQKYDSGSEIARSRTEFVCLFVSAGINFPVVSVYKKLPRLQSLQFEGNN